MQKLLYMPQIVIRRSIGDTRNPFPIDKAVEIFFSLAIIQLIAIIITLRKRKLHRKSVPIQDEPEKSRQLVYDWDMRLIINDEQLQTIEQIKQFLEGGEPLEFRGLSTEEKYKWIETALVKFKYVEVPADMGTLVPSALAEPFTTSDLALAIAKPHRLAQKMVYCLRLMDCITPTGKRGNAILYSRAMI